MVRFAKSVFGGQGEFHDNRPTRGPDRRFVNHDQRRGVVFGSRRRRSFTCMWKMWMRLINEQSKREQKHLSFDCPKQMFWAPPWPTGRREIPKHRSRSFCTGTRPRRTYGGISFRSWHRQRIASHQISSGWANRENQTSSIRLPTMFGTSMRSSLSLESRQHSS